MLKFLLNKFSLKLILPIPLLMTVAVVASTIILPNLTEQGAVQESVSSATRIVEQLKVLRGYYTQNIVRKALQSGALTPSVDHKDDETRIPLPATMIHDLSKLLAEKGTDIRLYSPYPFPNRQDRVLDAFQVKAWDFLTKNPQTEFVTRETIDGKELVRVGIADTLVSSQCVDCHNSRADTPKNDWKLGDVRGVLEVDIEINSQLANGEELSKMVIGGIILTGLLMMCISVLLAHQAIQKDVAQNENSKSELKEIDRMKSEFIASASHELRTPITSIKGSLGLMSGGVAGEISKEAVQLLKIADDNADRLIELVDDILTIGKLDYAQLSLDFKPISLNKMLSETVTAVSGIEEKYGVSFHIVDPIPEVVLNVDQGKIRQALTNLMANAAKFSPAGETVEISATCRDGQAQISVSDHGCGISDEFKKRIFERFTQEISSDIRMSGGSGLGLSITKSIVENHHGFLEFDSKQGVGSTFHIILPIIE